MAAPGSAGKHRVVPEGVPGDAPSVPGLEEESGDAEDHPESRGRTPNHVEGQVGQGRRIGVGRGAEIPSEPWAR
jgi:hypothetical protein